MLILCYCLLFAESSFGREGMGRKEQNGGKERENGGMKGNGLRKRIGREGKVEEGKLKGNRRKKEKRTG